MKPAANKVKENYTAFDINGPFLLLLLLLPHLWLLGCCHHFHSVSSPLYYLLSTISPLRRKRKKNFFLQTFAQIYRSRCNSMCNLRASCQCQMLQISFARHSTISGLCLWFFIFWNFLAFRTWVDEDMVESMCGESYQCKYDYSTSLSREIAVFTKYYQDQFVNIREAVLKPEARGIFMFTLHSSVQFILSRRFAGIGGLRNLSHCPKLFI